MDKFWEKAFDYTPTCVSSFIYLEIVVWYALWTLLGKQRPNFRTDLFPFMHLKTCYKFALYFIY
jgi:hypothetical protein